MSLKQDSYSFFNFHDWHDILFLGTYNLDISLRCNSSIKEKKNNIRVFRLKCCFCYFNRDYFDML